ncbi:MAG: hypothetical protein IT258_17480 [Saprospiraceae bacterium]|nr:hypothetical protein [Saprospiraceae bacterium]
MKTNRFFILSLMAAFAVLFFCSQANAQSTRANLSKRDTENSRVQPDLALISCKTSWLGNGIVNVEWTVRNDGKGNCPLISKEGSSLVSYTVDGTGDKNANAQAGNWLKLQENTPLDAPTKELAPGDTATGNFTFDTEGKKELVSYRVSLEIDNGIDQKRENNVYVGQIGK